MSTAPAPARPAKHVSAPMIAGALFAVAAAAVIAVAVMVSGRPSPAPAPAAPALSAVEQAYVAQLGAIDPGLVVNEQRAVSRGQAVCALVARGDSQAAVVEGARARFDGGDAAVGAAEAQRIVAALAASGLCQG